MLWPTVGHAIVNQKIFVISVKLAIMEMAQIYVHNVQYLTAMTVLLIQKIYVISVQLDMVEMEQRYVLDVL